MSRLIGWIDSPIGAQQAPTVVAQMLDAAGPDRDARRAAKTEPAAALAIEGDGKGLDVAAEEAGWAAIVGRPRWEDPHLAALAGERGYATSLIAAFARHGPTLLQRLRGSFALAAIDRTGRRALLAIDRFGICTLCYGQPRSGGLVFGSRTDAVAAHPAMDVTVSPQAIFDYLYFGVIQSPATIYREQRKLMPAQYVFYQDGAVLTDFYWRMPYGERRKVKLSELSRELMERLATALARSIADADRSALGAFLSGGLDSSTVVGLLSAATERHARTFTVGFGEERYDEIHYAEVAARHFGAAHRNCYLTPADVTASLLPLARSCDEPFGNSSVVPAYHCAKTARADGISLMLAGDGGDEIFGGNSRYVEQLILAAYSAIPAALRDRVIEPLILATPAFAKIPLARKLQGYVRRARIPLPERLESHNYYRNADLSQVFAPAFLAAIDVGAPLAKLREAYARGNGSTVLQRLFELDLKITLADNDLRKVGTACSLAGLGVAYPFLDDDVVEFSARVPPELVIRHLRRRWFFKQAVRGFLPRETLAKRKHGFGMPFAEWPRSDRSLNEIFMDALAGFGMRGYFREDFSSCLMSGRRDPTRDGLAWDVVMLELWLRAHEWRCRSAQVAD
jgi:asparagine synthase (glutamine-hydrolysing)